MSTAPYPYHRKLLTRYTFVSKGRKGAIAKAVEFSPTSNRLILNMDFGDVLPDAALMMHQIQTIMIL